MSKVDNKAGRLQIYMNLGSCNLPSYISSIVPNPEFITNVLHVILNALTYFAGSSYIYKNLKPSNIVITSEGFMLLTENSLVNSFPNFDYFKSPYTCPDVFTQVQVDQSVDIYSFGCILFYLLTHTDPPNLPPRNMAFPPTFPTQFRILLECTMCTDKNNRLAISNIRHVLNDPENALNYLPSNCRETLTCIPHGLNQFNLPNGNNNNNTVTPTPSNVTLMNKPLPLDVSFHPSTNNNIPPSVSSSSNNNIQPSLPIPKSSSPPLPPQDRPRSISNIDPINNPTVYQDRPIKMPFRVKPPNSSSQNKRGSSSQDSSSVFRRGSLASSSSSTESSSSNINLNNFNSTIITHNKPDENNNDMPPPSQSPPIIANHLHHHHQQQPKPSPASTPPPQQQQQPPVQLPQQPSPNPASHSKQTPLNPKKKVNAIANVKLEFEKHGHV